MVVNCWGNSNVDIMHKAFYAFKHQCRTSVVLNYKLLIKFILIMSCLEVFYDYSCYMYSLSVVVLILIYLYTFYLYIFNDIWFYNEVILVFKKKSANSDPF